MHASHGGGEKASKVLRISLFVTWPTLCCWWLPASAPIRWPCFPKPATICRISLRCCSRWSAVYLQSRPPSSTKTYGYHRAGVLAALINAVSLVVISFFIFYEAFHRLQNPEPVHAGVMIGVAAAGVMMNGVIALMLYRSGGDINIRSALFTKLATRFPRPLSSPAAGPSSLTGQYWIDSALSFGIGALILWSGFGILRETMNILLEGTPRGHETRSCRGRHARRSRASTTSTTCMSGASARKATHFPATSPSPTFLHRSVNASCAT